MDSPVHSPRTYQTYRKRLEVLDVKIQPLRDNIFGDVRSGVIRLKCGPLVQFTLLLPHPTGGSKVYKIQSGGHQFLSSELMITWDYLEAKDSTGTLYLLTAQEQSTVVRISDGYVLEATACKKGEYRRIGTWHLGESYRHHQKLLEEHRKIRSALEFRAPEDAYAEVAADEEEGKPQFVITLI